METYLETIKEWDLLREAYTSVTDRDIFDKRWYRPMPFKKNGKINYFSIIYALLFKKNSLGTSNALRKTIDKFNPKNEVKVSKQYKQNKYN